jgi:hypothetical protein
MIARPLTGTRGHLCEPQLMNQVHSSLEYNICPLHRLVFIRFTPRTLYIRNGHSINLVHVVRNRIFSAKSPASFNETNWAISIRTLR